MNSSFIKMLHILISTSGERASESSGGVEKRKENFAKTATIPSSKERHPCSLWPWCPVPRRGPGLKSPDTFHTALLSFAPWTDRRAQRQAGNGPSQGNNHKGTGDITLEGACTALKEVGREGVRPRTGPGAEAW